LSPAGATAWRPGSTNPEALLERVVAEALGHRTVVGDDHGGGPVAGTRAAAASTPRRCLAPCGDPAIAARWSRTCWSWRPSRPGPPSIRPALRACGARPGNPRSGARHRTGPATCGPCGRCRSSSIRRAWWPCQSARPRNRSLMLVLDRVFASTCLTITAQYSECEPSLAGSWPDTTTLYGGTDP